MIRPTFIYLNPDEHNQGLRHFQFIISLHKCDGRCKSIDYPSIRICILNKKQGASLNILDMMTKIDESKY